MKIYYLLLLIAIRIVGLGAEYQIRGVNLASDLTKLIPVQSKQQVEILGRISIGDGGGGKFFWDSSSTLRTNSDVFAAPYGSATGRWIRVKQDSGGIEQTNAVSFAIGFPMMEGMPRITHNGTEWVSSISAEDLKPTPAVIYYVNSGSSGGSWGAGNDSNVGTNKANPKQSLWLLIGNLYTNGVPGHVEIVLKENQYYSSTLGWNNSAILFPCSVVVENDGVAWLPSGRCGAEFSLSSGAVYERIGHVAHAVYTWTTLGEYGEPTKMVENVTAWASLAALQAGLATNEWTLYAGNTYLRMWDDSVPTVETMTVASVSFGSPSVYIQDVNFYASGLRMTGHGAAINWRSRTNSNAFMAGKNLWMCGNKGTNDLYQYDIDTGFSFLEDCRADWGVKDGFNYHQNIDPQEAFMVEINCTATRNGIADNDNGSTTHEMMRSIRVNGFYAGNYSRNLHDVNYTQSVLINCKAGQSVLQDITDDAAFVIGQGGLTTSTGYMWLIDCTSLGGGPDVIDYYSAENSTMYLIGSTASNPNDVLDTDAGARISRINSFLTPGVLTRLGPSTYTGTNSYVLSESPTITGTMSVSNIVGSGTINGSNLLGTNSGDGYNDDLMVSRALGGSMVGYMYSGGGPESITQSLAMTDGSVRFVCVIVPKSTTITGVMFYLGVQGDYTDDNNNKVGLYRYSSGTYTLVAQSANRGDLWKAAINTLVKEPFASPYSAEPGVYFVGYVWNASSTITAPSIRAIANAVTSTTGFDYTNNAKTVGAVAGTDLPSTQAASGIAVGTTRPWVSVY